MSLLITLVTFQGNTHVFSQVTPPEGIDYKVFLDGTKLNYQHDISINESYGADFVDFIITEFTTNSIFKVNSINSSYIEMDQTMTVSMDSYANINDTVYYPDYYMTLSINDTNTGTLSSNFVANTTSMDITILDANGTDIRPTAVYKNNGFNEVDQPGVISLASNNFYQIKPNSSNWAVGEVVDGYTVNGTEVFHGLNAWLLWMDLGWATFQLYYEKNTGILLGVFGHAESSRSIIITSYTLDLSVFENDIPVIGANDGFTVNSTLPVNISFQVIDDNIVMYNLYQNDTIFTSGSKLTDWSFIITPDLGNTTWTLEVIDKFNIKTSATTWVKYEIPSDNTSIPDTETTSKDSISATIPSSFNPVFVFGIYAFLIYYIIKKSSKK
ncbi:MAG: hypothetical protein GPJ54_13475 [Candidatus Heimdallarchaeota archaeon]|nr:hypothetical protein [Candidatus Heimdallarchaeota archaeon]